MSGVNIDISATDNASSTIESVKGSVDDLGDSGKNTSDAMGSFTTSLSSSARVGDSALLAVDRMQVSQDGLTNAQIRQELAQTRLTDAVSKYGAGSDQATKAQQEYQIATDNVTTAHIRMEERMISTALVTIPRMITGIKQLISSYQESVVATDEASAATEANTEVDLAQIAVITLGIGLPVALAALALAQSANVGGGSTSNNVYGDININSTGPVNAASTAQFATSARP